MSDESTPIPTAVPDSRPEWASEIIRKLEAFWEELINQRKVQEDHEQRLRSLEATREENDRLRRLGAVG